MIFYIWIGNPVSAMGEQIQEREEQKMAKKKKEKREPIITRTFTIEYHYNIYSLVDGETCLLVKDLVLDHKIRNSELNGIAKEKSVSNAVAELVSQVDELRAMKVNDFMANSYVIAEEAVNEEVENNEE